MRRHAGWRGNPDRRSGFQDKGTGGLCPRKPRTRPSSGPGQLTLPKVVAVIYLKIIHYFLIMKTKCDRKFMPAIATFLAVAIAKSFFVGR